MTKKHTKEFDFYEKLEKSVINQIHSIVDITSEEIHPSNQLLPAKQQADRRKLALTEFVKEIGKELNRIDLAMEAFNKYKSQYLNKQEIREFEKEMNDLYARLLKFSSENHPGSESFQEFFGLSNFIVYCLYSVAYHLSHIQQYKAAADLFFYLTLINPYIKDHWKGLGMAELENDRIDIAISAFIMASLLDAKDPSPHIFLAQCYLAENDHEAARVELQNAKNIAEQHPEHWHDEIKALEIVLEDM